VQRERFGLPPLLKLEVHSRWMRQKSSRYTSGIFAGTTVQLQNGVFQRPVKTLRETYLFSPYEGLGIDLL
jgi:hypothetical protein